MLKFFLITYFQTFLFSSLIDYNNVSELFPEEI